MISIPVYVYGGVYLVVMVVAIVGIVYGVRIIIDANGGIKRVSDNSGNSNSLPGMVRAIRRIAMKSEFSEMRILGWILVVAGGVVGFLTVCSLITTIQSIH
jgi:hypothetical protein